jgi:exonuclease SbcD
MRIIHTADWHLCDRLGHVDRTDDLNRRVKVVADLCESHRVDALVIAGDLFSEQASVESMTAALTHLHGVFEPFFRRGGTILSVTGNHDRETRIEMLRAGMHLASPFDGSRRFLPGRMYILNRPFFGSLITPQGASAQFVLIPYPTASRYAQATDEFRSKEEETRILQLRVAEEIFAATHHPEFVQSVPTLLAAHLHVRGAEVHALYRISERDDITFSSESFPDSCCYVALGHIHKPQRLDGKRHIRYPGSLDRLDFTEQHDDKGVLLLELAGAGLVGEPTWLPIPSTPMYDIVITDPATELATLADRHPDRETALVRARVAHMPDGPSRSEIHRQLRRMFPRLKELEFLKPDAPVGGRRGFKPQADYRATIREFVAKELAEDADGPEVLALLETFLPKETPS